MKKRQKKKILIFSIVIILLVVAGLFMWNNKKIYLSPEDKKFGVKWIKLNQNENGVLLSPGEIQWANHLKAIHAPEAWELTEGKENVIIAIIDNGIDLSKDDYLSRCGELNNPDLRSICSNSGVFWINPGEGASADNVDNDNNGYTDDLIGWDFFGGDNIPTSEGPEHGTWLAGLIRAEETSSLDNVGSPVKIKGICPKCKLMIVRIDRGIGTDLPFPMREDTLTSEMIAKGYRYAADNGAKIIISSQTEGDGRGERSKYASPIVKEAITYANSLGALVIVSAGNGGHEGSDYPAKFENVMSVGATDDSDLISKEYYDADFSNYGDVEISAPGVMISPWYEVNEQGYALSLTGTSYSAPIVAAVAGLIKSVNSDLTNTQMKSIMINTADKLNTRHNIGGRINAQKAVLLAHILRKNFENRMYYSKSYLTEVDNTIISTGEYFNSDKSKMIKVEFRNYDTTEHLQANINAIKNSQSNIKYLGEANGILYSKLLVNGVWTYIYTWKINDKTLVFVLGNFDMQTASADDLLVTNYLQRYPAR